MCVLPTNVIKAGPNVTQGRLISKNVRNAESFELSIRTRPSFKNAFGSILALLVLVKPSIKVSGIMRALL